MYMHYISLYIKYIRKKRYEELEPQVMIDRVKDAKDLKRSKHMDMWSSNELSGLLSYIYTYVYIYIYKYICILEKKQNLILFPYSQL
jgi:hypothetical protein